MASDKVDDAMMGPAEAISLEDRIGLGGEVTIGKEQKLDPLPHILVMRENPVAKRFYVRHVDLSRNL